MIGKYLWALVILILVLVAANNYGGEPVTIMAASGVKHGTLDLTTSGLTLAWHEPDEDTTRSLTLGGADGASALGPLRVDKSGFKLTTTPAGLQMIRQAMEAQR